DARAGISPAAISRSAKPDSRPSRPITNTRGRVTWSPIPPIYPADASSFLAIPHPPASCWMKAVNVVRSSMKIEISVVIATYKRPYLLEGTLAALAAQKVTDPLGWEVVVVDNNSQDEAWAVVTAFAKTVSIPVGCVLESRQGLSRARNRGIAAAQGAIIAFIDDDVLPAADWIARVHQAMRRWGAHGVGGPILPRWEAPPPIWLTSNLHLMAPLAILPHPPPPLLSSP